MQPQLQAAGPQGSFPAAAPQQLPPGALPGQPAGLPNPGGALGPDQQQQQMQQPPMMQQQQQLPPVANGAAGPNTGVGIPNAVGSPGPHLQPTSANLNSPGMSFGMQMAGAGVPSAPQQVQPLIRYMESSPMLSTH
jgi:hypothetical protein